MDSRLLWLALAAFVGAVEGGLIAGLLPSISAEMGVTVGQAGLLVTCYALAYAFGTPLLAVVLGGVGRRRVLALSEAGLAVCALLLALSPVFEWAVAVRTMLAVCAGTFTGTAMATAAMIAPPGQRGRALQVVTLGQALAGLVGVPVGAWVATQFSWRFDYAAIAAMAAAASLALYLKLPRGMPGDTQTMRERIRVLGNPGVPRALAVTLLVMSGVMAVTIYIGPIVLSLGLGLETLPLVLLAGGIGGVATSISAGRIADRLGNRPTVIVTVMLATVGLATYLLLPLTPEHLRLPALMALIAVQAYVGWGFWIAHCSQMARLAPTSVPVAISLDMAAMNIGMAISAAAGGVVVDTWGAGALPIVGIPVLIVALVIWLTIPEPVDG